MTEEFQKHAFEAFERERTSTESKTEGTGLGLAIAKEIIRVHGAKAQVFSIPGVGTRFEVTFPKEKVVLC